jgi:hypothetical protein
MIDVITPAINIAYALIKKYWKYVVMLILLIIIFILYSMFAAEREAHRETELDRQRIFQNNLNLDKKVSEYSQTISLTQAELKRTENIKQEFEKVSEKLKVAEKNISRLHLIIANSSSSDRVVIKRDTIYIDSTNYKLVNSINIKSGCVTGKAYWEMGKDTADVELNMRTDLTIADYVQKSKGHVGRDFKRFFTGRWKLIGSDKWDAKVIVINNCDSAQIYEKNITINKIKK